eukprot:5506339-Pleurochrysis_carterae.AAC.1
MFLRIWVLLSPYLAQAHAEYIRREKGESWDQRAQHSASKLAGALAAYVVILGSSRKAGRCPVHTGVGIRYSAGQWFPATHANKIDDAATQRFVSLKRALPASAFAVAAKKKNSSVVNADCSKCPRVQTHAPVPVGARSRTGTIARARSLSFQKLSLSAPRAGTTMTVDETKKWEISERERRHAMMRSKSAAYMQPPSLAVPQTAIRRPTVALTCPTDILVD